MVKPHPDLGRGQVRNRFDSCPVSLVNGLWYREVRGWITGASKGCGGDCTLGWQPRRLDRVSSDDTHGFLLIVSGLWCKTVID
jgi:hypothetical protein